jgi:hypothetical protein
MGEPKPQLMQQNPNGDFIMTSAEEWTFDDRQAAMDLAVYESELCQGCGYPLEETTDPGNEFAYVADPPIRCHRCTASESAQDIINKVHEAYHPSALSFSIRMLKEVTTDADQR